MLPVRCPTSIFTSICFPGSTTARATWTPASSPPALALARRTLLEVGISRSTAESLIGSTPHRLLATGIASRRPVAA
jgi:hypothetical protein